MPQSCSQCDAEVADGKAPCPHCGQSPAAASSFQEQQAERDRRFPFWTVLPWALLAAVALSFLPHLLRSSQGANSPAAASRPAAAPMPPSAMTAPASSAVSAPVAIAPAAVPLSVTLSSAGSGRRVLVGKPVTISAFASLPQGESATLAISYGKAGDPKTLLALSQGSLTSAVWTPTAPGRYRFTASALDSRKNGAFSNSMTILVTGPPLVPAVSPVPLVPAVSPVPVVPAIVQPAHVHPAAVQPTAVRPAATRTTAERSKVPRPQVQVTSAPKPRAVTPVHPQPYHVAAASFRVKQIAETLAGALRQRGFHAFVRLGVSGQYRVETGDFTRRADAVKQMQLLQRDGYPSSVFQTR